MKFRALFLVFCVCAFAACGDDDDSVSCETEGVTYNNDIKQILDTNCSLPGCHGEGGASFPMVDFTSSSVAASFGRIVGAINHEEGFSPMPRNGDKIDQCDIDKLTAWIEAGTPE